MARTVGCLGLVIAFAVLLSACGDPTVRVSLVYAPTHTPDVVPGAGAVALDVVNQDKRVQFKDRIGAVRGGRNIGTDSDPSELVRGAVEQELKGQGFVVAPGGLVLTVELQNFFCDYGFASSINIGFTIRLRDASGRTLYSHYYEGGANSGDVLTFDMKGAVKKLVEQALAQALDLVAGDKSLQRALLFSNAKAELSGEKKT